MLNGKTRQTVKNGIFSGKKCHFWILAENPKTNTTLLLPKNLNFCIPESDLQYVAKQSPQETKMAFLGHFLAKNGLFGQWAHLKITISFGFSMGSNSHRCSCRFLILAFFSHFWLIFKFLRNQQKIQELNTTLLKRKF